MNKKIATLLFLLVIILVQCRTKNKPALIGDDKLAAQYFTVDVERDTTLKTGKGALISIPKGSIKSTTGTVVKLEVKEAYDMVDIVLAGLTTKAGSKLLSSGGMICIDPVEGSATMVSPIAVSIPTKYQQHGMQLYKGERTPDGKIDWTSPQPLPTQEQSPTLAKGKVLYNDNCASCHDIKRDATGPALAYDDQRREWAWLTRFVQNPSKMIAEGDERANCSYNLFNRASMTASPYFSDTDIRSIFDYIDDQARDVYGLTAESFKRSLDSCRLYNKLTRELNEKRDSLIVDNGAQATVENIDQKISRSENGPLSKPDNMVAVAKNNASYYQFKIQTFGWYNVDIVLRDIPGFENSSLTVRLIGEYRKEVNIYLVVPSHKLFFPGGPVKDETDEYAFYTDDGNIPLPQNSKAYIIAMGEYNRQLYFGKTDFVTGLKQNFSMQLSVTTKEQMNIEIKKLNIEDLNITAADSKNATEIRKIDARLDEIEKYKPKIANCNCLDAGLRDTASIR